MKLNHLFAAAWAGSAVDNTKNPVLCRTEIIHKSRSHVPTVTETTTITSTIHSTAFTQETSTVTPKASFETSTTTVITTIMSMADPRNSRAEVLATEYETSTVSAEAITFTEYASTSTVKTLIGPSTFSPAPINFSPVRDTLYDSSMRLDSGSPLKRDVAASQSKNLDKRSPAAGRLVILSPKNDTDTCKPILGYPRRVECTATAAIHRTISTTQTGPPLTITAPTPISIVTKTNTILSIETIFPTNATAFTTSVTTSIIKETVTPSLTTTTTSTTVNTETLPGPTHYGMCPRENFADGRYSRGYFKGISVRNYYPADSFQVDSAYECCALCARSETCIAAGYSDSCYLFKNIRTSRCSPSEMCYNRVKWVDDPGLKCWVAINGPGMRFNKYV